MGFGKPIGAIFLAVSVSGCITTSMQGYADLNPTARPIQHMIAYVAAPTPLAASIQQSIGEQAQKRGILAEDAFNLLPPTRTYTDAELRQVLAQRNVDSVLVIQVGDSGITKEYA